MTSPSALEDHLGYHLRRVSNAVSGRFAARLAERETSVAEWVTLRLLHDAPAAPSRLADTLGMTRGAVTRIADRLIARGLVLRAADPEDGRAKALALSAAGRALVPALAELADANDAAFFADLSEPDRAELRRLLAALAARHGLAAPPTA